jgi:signal transduction histidine kinase/ActR/RegA family two-component response regulator
VTETQSTVPERQASLVKTFEHTGSAFLDSLCETAKDTFDANTAYVASLRLVESEYLAVESVCPNRPDLNIAGYCTTGTPCVEVYTSGLPVTVCSDVRVAYPDIHVLEELGSEAYLGLPLENSKGTCIGVFVLEWSESQQPSTMQHIAETLTPYLARISDELKRKIEAHVLPALVSRIRPLTSLGNIEMFQNIVEQAAAITKVATVAIVHRLPNESARFRMLVIHSTVANVDNLEQLVVEYQGIPCSNMITNDVFLESSGVMQKYPDMPLLEQLQAESYLGFGFRDTSGNAIGHIAFLHNRPMRTSVKDCQVINIISSRAGQELQRYALEQQRDAMGASLRVRSKLESLGTMAGTIAHDFNNQLTAMIANTELASIELPESHPSKVFLENAEQSMWRARDVISEILEFAGNSKTAPVECVSLGEVVASAVKDFEQHRNERSQIVSEVAPDLPDIESRRIQIVQILSNLIANGLDAQVDGAQHKVRIAVDMAEMSASERAICLTGRCSKLPTGVLRVQIKDTGRGMNSETAERIFDPYFSTKGVSRGLGLSSVLGIAKRLNIGVTFDSKPGVGTTFRLYFAIPEPAASARPAARPAAGNEKVLSTPSPRRVATHKTALIVDDESSVNKAISDMLGLWGWHVLTAYSGEQAVTLAESTGELDLAFVDVVMPGMSGFETLDKIRTFHPDVPGVLVSGYSENSRAVSLENDKRVVFLVKPFGAHALKSAIEELVNVQPAEPQLSKC